LECESGIIRKVLEKRTAYVVHYFAVSIWSNTASQARPIVATGKAVLRNTVQLKSKGRSLMDDRIYGEPP
ncbi:hypothetical protein, partial [Stenotrophomonas maltophilia]|uniref:hypothetical protein n=1 Tax=Stenotrophomonas maltophilia TaxID=40324 RepID=UPI001954EE8D